MRALTGAVLTSPFCCGRGAREVHYLARYRIYGGVCVPYGRGGGCGGDSVPGCPGCGRRGHGDVPCCLDRGLGGGGVSCRRDYGCASAAPGCLGYGCASVAPGCLGRDRGCIVPCGRG